MTATINRRTLIKGAGASALAAAASANLIGLHRIADAAAQNGPVSIEYWHRNGGDTATTISALADKFNQEFGDKVKVTAVFQTDRQTLNQKIRAAAQGGGMPGAAMADDYDVTEYYFNDILTPLDDYINDATNGLTADDVKDFLPTQLNRHKLDIYGGKTMAFPQVFSAFATWYNIDALAAAGYDAPPTSWADFPDMARAIAKANPGMSVWTIGGAGDRFISCMRTYNVDWIKPGGTESNFDAPEVLEILKWWKDLSDGGMLTVTTESAIEIFGSGGSAFYMDSSASVTGLAQIKDFKWSGAFPPQGPNVTSPATETYGPVNIVPKTSEAEQLAGWLWVKWLASPEAQDIYVPVTDYFPSRNSVVNDKALADFYTQYPIAKTMYTEIAPKATILTPSPALREVRSNITADAVTELLLDKLSPEDAQKKLKAEADDAIKQAMQS